MAVSGSLSYLQFGGRFYGAEEWSCGLHIHYPAGVAPGAPFDIEDTYLPAVQAWFTSAGAQCSSSAKLDYVKVNVIDPVTGKYLDATGSNTHLIVNGPSGAQSASFPPQCSLSVSLYTAIPRGPASRGRFYPPMGFSTINTDGRTSVENATAAAAAAATFVNAVNNVGGGGTGNVVVFSKSAQSVRAVTGVRVGRVVDTQRRRRGNLPEEYILDPLA